MSSNFVSVFGYDSIFGSIFNYDTFVSIFSYDYRVFSHELWFLLFFLFCTHVFMFLEDKVSSQEGEL